MGPTAPRGGGYVRVGFRLRVIHAVFDGNAGLNRIGTQLLSFRAG